MNPQGQNYSICCKNLPLQHVTSTKGGQELLSAAQKKGCMGITPTPPPWCSKINHKDAADGIVTIYWPTAPPQILFHPSVKLPSLGFSDAVG